MVSPRLSLIAPSGPSSWSQSLSGYSVAACPPRCCAKRQFAKQSPTSKTSFDATQACSLCAPSTLSSLSGFSWCFHKMLVVALVLVGLSSQSLSGFSWCFHRAVHYRQARRARVAIPFRVLVVFPQLNFHGKKGPFYGSQSLSGFSRCFHMSKDDVKKMLREQSQSLSGFSWCFHMVNQADQEINYPLSQSLSGCSVAACLPRCCAKGQFTKQSPTSKASFDATQACSSCAPSILSSLSGFSWCFHGRVVKT